MGTGYSWHLCCRPCTQCIHRVCRSEWITAASLGCFVSLRTSSFHTNWYHLMPSSTRRHHWSSASILRASVLDIAQQSEPYRNIGKMHVLYSFNFVEMASREGRPVINLRPHQISNPELGNHKGNMGSCPQVLHFLSAVSLGFSLVLDTRGRLGGLKRKVGSACEEFEDNEGGILG